MFLVYYISMVTVGSAATDWANDGLFGDGWHLLGIGSKAYSAEADNFTAASQAVQAFTEIEVGADDFDADKALDEMKSFSADSETATVDVEDEETLAVNTMTAYFSKVPSGLSKAEEEETVAMSYTDAVKYFEKTALMSPTPPITAYGFPVYRFS